MIEANNLKVQQMDHKKIVKGIALISQIGISMIAPMVVCGIAGYLLDENFDTSFWFIVFILLGIAAGFRNVYLLIKKFYDL